MKFSPPLRSFSRRAGAAALLALSVLSLSDQSTSAKASESSVATNADVLGAERLFSAWMEGQIGRAIFFRAQQQWASLRAV